MITDSLKEVKSDDKSTFFEVVSSLSDEEMTVKDAVLTLIPCVHRNIGVFSEGVADGNFVTSESALSIYKNIFDLVILMGLKDNDIAEKVSASVSHRVICDLLEPQVLGNLEENLKKDNR